MLYEEFTEPIVRSAIEVHRQLGPGLLEAVYQAALCIELHEQNIAWEREVLVPVLYRGVRIGEYRPDLIVQKSVVVEIKSVSRHDPVFDAQVLTYLRLTGLKLGLLLNFNRPVLKDGIKRYILL